MAEYYVGAEFVAPSEPKVRLCINLNSGKNVMGLTPDEAEHLAHLLATNAAVCKDLTINKIKRTTRK